MKNLFNKLTEKRILLGITIGSLIVLLGSMILVHEVKFSSFQVMTIGLTLPVFFIMISLLLYSAKKWINNFNLIILLLTNYLGIYYFEIYQGMNTEGLIPLLTGLGLASFPFGERDGIISLIPNKFLSFFIILYTHIFFSWLMELFHEFFIEMSKFA
jgi:hypothetical protein